MVENTENADQDAPILPTADGQSSFGVVARPMVADTKGVGDVEFPSVIRTALLLLAVFLAIPIGILGAIFAWIYFSPNRHPPELFAQQFKSEHLIHPGDVDAEITEILMREFPPGTPVSDLKSALYKKGFRDVPPPPPGCVPSFEKAKELGLRPPYEICPDRRNVMEYGWAIGLVCGGSIYVTWSPDQSSQIRSIKGTARMSCL